VKPAVKFAVEETADERQQLISELFHALSQPITALRCSLELALYDQAVTLSKENLQTALTHAEKIAQLASGIRELVQADDPGDERIELALGDYLHEAMLDMQPIAAAAQVEMQLEGKLADRVIAEPRRLRQALFYWLEFSLASAVAGSMLNLKISAQDGLGIVTLYVDRENSGSILSAVDAEARSQKLSRRLGLAIAGRIFESAGGGLQMQDNEQSLRLRFYLPLAVLIIPS